MFLPNLILLSSLLLPGTGIAQDSTHYPEPVEDPSDTLPAVELSDTLLYLQDTSGASRQMLDSCFACLRDLLRQTVQQGWQGTFTFEDLASRFSKIRKFPMFEPASFQLFASRHAVYASYLDSSGFVSTICIVQDTTVHAIVFSFATSQGTSTGVAAPMFLKK